MSEPLHPPVSEGPPRAGDPEVPLAVAELAYRLSDGFELAPPPRFRTSRFVWGGKDVSAFGAEVSVEKDRLEIDFDDGDALQEHLKGRESDQGPFEGEMDSGWRVSSDQSLHLRADLLLGFYWRLLAPSSKPLLWVAKLSGIERGSGWAAFGVPNVSFIRKGNGLIQGHLFRGAYSYFLVHREEEHPEGTRSRRSRTDWFIIVDTGGSAPPQRRDLFNDTLALQFVLGRVLFFDLLFGLDESGQVLGYLGGRCGRHSDRQQRDPPVPLFAPHWASVFFSRISTACREKPEVKLYLPLSLYLDMLTAAHVQSEYLLAHVGLEAFAFHISRHPDVVEDVDQQPLVDDAAWRRWLSSNRGSIKSLAVGGQGDRLVSRIENAVKRQPSSRVVEECFKKVRLAMLPEMEQQLRRGRNLIVHRAELFAVNPADISAYRVPISIVRTMIAALVGRLVGYDGALRGWEQEAGGNFADAPADWWTVSRGAKAEASRRHFRDIPVQATAESQS